jgi:hypothetical protein
MEIDSETRIYKLLPRDEYSSLRAKIKHAIKPDHLDIGPAKIE